MCYNLLCRVALPPVAASLFFFDRNPTSDLYSARLHGRVDAVCVLVNLALCVAFNLQQRLSVALLAVAVGVAGFVHLGCFVVVRPYTVANLNNVRAASAAACIWASLCLFVANSLRRQVLCPRVVLHCMCPNEHRCLRSSAARNAALHAGGVGFEFRVVRVVCD